MVAPIWKKKIKKILLTLGHSPPPKILKNFGNMPKKILKSLEKRSSASLYSALEKKKLGDKKVLTNVENENSAWSPASSPS